MVGMMRFGTSQRLPLLKLFFLPICRRNVTVYDSSRICYDVLGIEMLAGQVKVGMVPAKPVVVQGIDWMFSCQTSMAETKVPLELDTKHRSPA